MLGLKNAPRATGNKSGGGRGNNPPRGAKSAAAVLDVLRQGTLRAREVAGRTLSEVKAALGLNYF